jgi:glycosyltransferase involved in cell wall biosynthesis
MKIKICHFTNRITGKSDGVYAHLKMLFKNLDNSKYEQYLVFQGDKTIEYEVKEYGVTVLTLPNLNKKFSIKSFFQFILFINSQEIDIIHTHFLKPYAIAGISNIILRKKMIYNYHGLFIDNIYNTSLDKILYKIAHFIICSFGAVEVAIVPSFASKKALINETKIFPQTKVYYNGFDPSDNTGQNIHIVNYLTEIKNSYFLIGIVARIEIQKRIDLSLEIAKFLVQKHKNLFFVLFGDGPLENEMQSLANSLGLENNVKFFGYIPNVKSYIKFFDVLLFTSDWEGLPLTIWETMAAGIPIVSTDVGGVKEIIEQEKCGIIYPINSIEGGGNALEKILFNSELKKSMGLNGKAAVKNKYNVGSFIKSMESIYNETK